MTTQTAVGTPSRTCTPAQRVTRSLLGYGVLAGTVFEVSILIQGLTRHGFRLAHHDASLLSNGPLGWIQIATFLVSGAMTIACAVGMRRAMAGRAGGTWGPRLIAIFGAGLMAAGLLRADPAYGFGPGAPAAFAGVTTGSDASAIVLPFYAGVLIAWIWIAVTSVYLYRRAGTGLAGTGLAGTGPDPAGH